MATAERESPWVDGAEACRLLDLPHVRNVDRLVREGLVRVRGLPGVRARFSRADVERLARETASSPR